MYVRSARSVASSSCPAPQRSMAVHVCQAPGCSLEIPRTHLMCPAHWFEVPLGVRTEVFQSLAAWLNGTETVRPYLIARLNAILHIVRLHKVEADFKVEVLKLEADRDRLIAAHTRDLQKEGNA